MLYQTYCKWAKEQKVELKCDTDLIEVTLEKRLWPFRTFTYMRLKTWLAEQLVDSEFETMLDSSLSSRNWREEKVPQTEVES